MNSVRSEGSRYRTLGRHTQFLTKALLIAIPVLGIFFIMDTPSYLGWLFLREQYYGLFLGLVFCTVFLVVPPTKRAPRNRIPWYDVILSILGFGVGLYVAVLYPGILKRMGAVTPDRVLLGTVAILLVLESVRRLTGWVLPIIGLIFILYARFTWLVPGVFHGPGIPWDRLVNSLFLDTNALLGTPMMVTAVIVLAFILFGNLLFGVGGGAFLTDFAVSIFGRFRGGPAKMAVVASSLFGTISGSAVANVATTGVITIPLMKKMGYNPQLAGAIEAVASTGGQLMPPIMGAAAFIIAEYTGIPYPKVAIAALFPAILFYIGVFVQVDLEAGKAKIIGLPRDQLPSMRGTLRESYLFVIPLAVLVYTLFILYLSPGKAALAGVLSILLISFIRRETRFHSAWVLEALEKTGRGLLELAVIVALAGFIIGVINFSGLGFIFPLILGRLAGANVCLLLLIIALTCIILGMGMPTVAVYILLGVLMGPALIELGIPVLAAHLFILYFGTLSMVTPPICLAAFAGAALAGSDSMRTGMTAMRVGILAYPVPFLFVFFPVLLLKGSPGEIALAAITAMAGSYMIGCAAVGYLFRALNSPVRVLLALAGIGLLIPASGQYYTFGLFSDIIGACLALPVLLWECREGKRREILRYTEAMGRGGAK